MISRRKFNHLLKNHETIVFWILVGILVAGSILSLMIPNKQDVIIIETKSNINDTLTDTNKIYSNINKYKNIKLSILDTIKIEPEQITQVETEPDTENTNLNRKLNQRPAIKSPKTISDEIVKIHLEKFTPKIEFGILNFSATPNADIIIVDNKKLSQGTPYSRKFSIGMHQIKYVNTTLNISWEKKIFLEKNETRKINYIFPEKTYGSLIVTLKNAFEYGYGYVYIDNNIWQEGGNNTTPLKIKLLTGNHKIEIKRTNFSCSPTDTTILIEKDIEKRISFTLVPEKKYSAH